MVSAPVAAPAQRPTSFASRVPLRLSLVALVVGVVFLGLLASGTALTAAMKDRLVSREDQTLRQAADFHRAGEAPERWQFCQHRAVDDAFYFRRA